MFAIANGRKALWQWDLNQQLTVAGSCTEVHYLDKGSPSTLTVAVKDGKADIPNILLQKAGRLIVYAYIIDAQDHHTKVCETFGIAPRPKPAEYVYTETEVKTWSNLQSQIGDLADLATEKKDNLVAAINEAARSGGAGAWYVTVTPGTNHSATADKTAAEVYAAYKAGKAVYCILLDAVGVVPAVLPLLAAVTVNGYLLCFAGSGAPRVSGSAPFSLTVTYDGAWHYFHDELVSGELVNSVSSSSTNKQVPSAKCLYDELQKRSLKQATSDTLGGVKADPATADDTQPVRINDSGKLVTAAGGADISLGIASATVGQTIKVKAVNEQGMPTAWEAINRVWQKQSEYNLKDMTFPAFITIPQGKDSYISIAGTDITESKDVVLNVTLGTCQSEGGYGSRFSFTQKVYAHGWGCGLLMMLLYTGVPEKYKMYRTGWNGGYDYTPFFESLPESDTGRIFYSISVDDAAKVNPETVAKVELYVRDALC